MRVSAGPDLFDSSSYWKYVGQTTTKGRQLLKEKPRPRGIHWPLTKPDDTVCTAYESWLLGEFDGAFV